MVKFVVEKHCGLARTGRLTQWGLPPRTDPGDTMLCILDHRTPSYLVYTRAGHIPHLTWDNIGFRFDFLQRPIFQICFPNIVQFLAECRKSNKPLADFLGMPEESLTHLSMADPLGKRESGYNREKQVAVWTRAGKLLVCPADLRKAIGVVQPSTAVSLLDYDVPDCVKNKRLSKSVARTTHFWQQTFNEPNNLYCSPFLALGGGKSHYHRSSMARAAAEFQRAVGVTVDLLAFSHNDLVRPRKPFDAEEVADLLQHSFAELPAQKPRITEGAFNPAEVFELVKLGVDLFDSSYASLAAERGQAFRVAKDYPEHNSFQTLDFSASEYSQDLSPVFEDCACYTCQNYTRAYVTHLFSTKELLAPMLLIIHNLSEFDHLFEEIRLFLTRQVW